MTPWKIAMEAAAKFIDDRCEAYVSEHGAYDYSTGVTEFPGNGEEWVGEQEETAEALRALPEPPEFRAAREADEEMLREARQVLTSVRMMLDGPGHILREAQVIEQFGEGPIPAIRFLLTRLEERLK